MAVNDFKIKVTAILDEKMLLSQLEKVEKNLNPLNLNMKAKSSTKQSTQNIAKNLGPLSSLIDRTSKRLAEMRSEGTLSTEMFNSLTREVDGVKNALSKGNITFAEGSRALTDITNKANGTKKGFLGMSQSLGSIIGKFSLWYIVAGLVTGVINGFKEMVKQVLILDEAMVELNKVFDGTKQQLESVKAESFKVATRLGTTGDAVIKATTEFKRMGYTIEESLDLAETAVKLTNVAEGIEDTGEAANILVSILKGTNTSVEYADSLLDRMNEVSNNNAISFKALAEMLQRSSATMDILGNNLDETIGLLTAGFEVLQDERVAKGISTIGLRIAGLNEDMEATAGLSNEVSEALQKYANIDIWDKETGQLKNTYTILSEVADKWEEIGQVGGNQEALLNALAGKQRADVAGAIINNWEAVEKSVKNAQNSMHSANEEQQAYLQSLKGSMAKLKNTFQEFSDRIIGSELVSTIIEIIQGVADALLPAIERISMTFQIYFLPALKSIANVLKILGVYFKWLGNIGRQVFEFIKPALDFFSYWFGYGWLREIIFHENAVDDLNDSYKDLAETFEQNSKVLSDYDQALLKLKNSMTNFIGEHKEWLEDIKTENDQLKKQEDIKNKLLAVEKAQQALAEARNKKVRVFRAGAKGFVWEEDEAGVQSAHENLQQAIDNLAKTKYNYAFEQAQKFIEELNTLLTEGNIVEGWDELFSKFSDLLGSEFESYLLDAQKFVKKFNDTMNGLGLDANIEAKNTAERQILKTQIEKLKSQLDTTTDKAEQESLKAQLNDLYKKYNKVGVKHNATGTRNFGGGETWVGERGAEIVSLPYGAEILDHNRSLKLHDIVENPAKYLAKATNTKSQIYNFTIQKVEYDGNDYDGFINKLIEVGNQSIPRL